MVYAASRPNLLFGDRPLRTLAILSRKGGTGKTTLALHLAVAARAGGLSTVVADLDRQQSAMDWRRLRRADDLAVEPVKPGALFARQQAAERAGRGLLIVDTGSNIEDEVEQAVRCADLCLIVTRPNFFDVKAVAESADLAMRLSRPAVFVINQAPSRRRGVESTVVGQAARTLQDLGLPLAPIGLRSRAAYQHSVAAGLTAQETDPRSVAAREIQALWTWVSAALWPAPATHWPPPPTVLEPTPAYSA